MSQKILITGAGGYIGSVAAYLFLQKGYEVVGVDHFLTGYKDVLTFLQEKFPRTFRFYEMDLKQDMSPLFEQEKDIKAVVHYAAHCLVDESMRNPGKYFQNNVLGTVQLLNTMVKYGVGVLVFSSTCAVYGDAASVPIDEHHPTSPSNPYGESKKIAEQIIDWYARLHGIRFVIFRYFNVCGASDDGLVGDSKKPSVLLVQNAVRGALGIEPFSLTCAQVDTPDKTPIRDYINVVDLNEAHLKAVEYLLAGGKSEIMNLGTGTGNSVLEIVHKVQKITGARFEVKTSSPRAGEYAVAIASIEKAQRVLGWKPMRSIEDSVRSLVKWYQLRPGGWER